MKQLPENLPGIIIIPFNPLNFYAVSVDYIIADIESELLKFPQLLSVSLYSQVMEERKEKKIEKIGNHFFIQSKSSNFIAEKRILIQNSHFKHDTSQQSLKKIIKAFGI